MLATELVDERPLQDTGARFRHIEMSRIPQALLNLPLRSSLILRPHRRFQQGC